MRQNSGGRVFYWVIVNGKGGGGQRGDRPLGIGVTGKERERWRVCRVLLKGNIMNVHRRLS